jgi:hypothetical protein
MKMKKNSFLVLLSLVLLTVVAGLLLMRAEKGGSTNIGSHAHSVSQPVAPESRPRIPAYQSAEQAQHHLAPTLEPSGFFGKAREAYQVAKKIPQTLAQLPCYCHCDQSFGHKSLHTCFEDDHASQCAVCVDEALLAYKLQTEDKLTPEQVRSRIVEKYSEGGHLH